MSLALASEYPTTRVEDYVQLLKPRVMSLVIFTGIVGLVIAPGTLPLALAITTIMCIAVGAGAAGAINMWYERDIDALMTRTRNRPLPERRIHPDSALGFGVSLAVASVLILGLTVNILAAALLAFSILFYVFVYTIWLKPRTPQNIVIGGLPGAMPPVIAWAAATGSVGALPLSLCLLTFLWTPPHFWALALSKSQDYARAGIPMMPVIEGRKSTQRQILAYSLLLIPASLLPAFLGAGMFYAIPAFLLSLVFVLLASALLHAPEEKKDVLSMRLFGYSILYLFLLFTLLLGDHIAS